MRIPDFPGFAPVELGHRQEVEDALSLMERGISEFSFANIHLFRRAHDYALSRIEGLILITARGYDGARYAFPPLGAGDVAGAARSLCDLLLREGFPPVIYPVPGRMFREFFMEGPWTGEADRDGADYVYLVSNLAELPGGKYHKKRNRLAKFLRELEGEYSYAEMGDAHLEECVAIARGWCDERCSIDRPSTFLETEAAVEALNFRRELGLSGGVALVGGRVEAYCLGEPLNEETFVVHFEKAVPGREGLAQLINRDFCKNSLGAFKYANREQDLGDPGLRQAKESYYPEFLAEKFRVRPVERK